MRCFFAIPATNKRITCDSLEVIKMKNGKVVENLTYFDVYSAPPEHLEVQQRAIE